MNCCFLNSNIHNKVTFDMSDQRILICILMCRLLKLIMWHNSHGNHIPYGKCIHGAKFQLCSSSHLSPSRIGPARPRLRHCMRKRGLVREFPDPLRLASVWPDRRKTFPEQKRHRTIQINWSGVSAYSLERKSSGELFFSREPLYSLHL